MTFAASESSLAAGTPYELHEFRLGQSATYWRYADAPVDIVYAGNTYTACYCEGSGIELGATAIKARTTVRVDWQNPFAWQYLWQIPEEIVHYTRYRGHGSDVQAIWIGDVTDVTFKQADRKGKRYAEIGLDPLTAAGQRAGCQPRYSRQCDADVYDARCGLTRASWETTGVLDSVHGDELTSTTFAAQPDGWWSGGYLVVGGRRRKIVSHAGNTIRVSPMLTLAAAGDSFSVYPGCDHLPATCAAKFHNLANYRGEPNIPDEDPSSPWGFA